MKQFLKINFLLTIFSFNTNNAVFLGAIDVKTIEEKIQFADKYVTNFFNGDFGPCNNFKHLLMNKFLMFIEKDEDAFTTRLSEYKNLAVIHKFALCYEAHATAEINQVIFLPKFPRHTNKRNAKITADYKERNYINALFISKMISLFNNKPLENSSFAPDCFSNQAIEKAFAFVRYNHVFWLNSRDYISKEHYETYTPIKTGFEIYYKSENYASALQSLNKICQLKKARNKTFKQSEIEQLFKLTLQDYLDNKTDLQKRFAFKGIQIFFEMASTVMRKTLIRSLKKSGVDLSDPIMAFLNSEMLSQVLVETKKIHDNDSNNSHSRPEKKMRCD
jgi:hypothetical protein